MAKGAKGANNNIKKASKVPSTLTSKRASAAAKNTTWHQRLSMIEFLESFPDYFKLITGQVHGIKVVAGAQLRKIDGFNKMAEYVNQNTNTNWTGENCKNRYRAYHKIYKKTARDYRSNNYEKFVIHIAY